MAGAPKGNKNGLKLKDPQIRQLAFRQYCEHISKGESKEAFHFEHAVLSVTFKTIERYIKENPIEFPAIHKELAEAKSLEYWERLGKSMMLGEVKGAQPAIYQMFMRNKFGWDKDLNHNRSGEETDVQKLVQKMAKAWRQLSSEQEVK